MSSIYDKYDDKLMENDFLKRHYECLPYIGEKYEKYRLLIIGESHYAENDKNGNEYLSSIDNKTYYEKKFEEINVGGFKEKEYEKWINTRIVLNHRKDDKVNSGFFTNITSEIAKVIFNNININYYNQNELKKTLDYFAFFNYFKRPSFSQGKEINSTKEDEDFAFNISKYIIDVIKPKYIAFISKRSYNLFMDRYKNDISNLEIEGFQHPSCPWWNIKMKSGKNAKEKFREFMNYIIKEA